MKRIIALIIVMTLVLTGCSFGSKRYVKENEDSFKEKPVSEEVYKTTVIKELTTLSAAADLIKMSLIQIGLGNRNYQEEIERVEKHIENIQDVRDMFVNLKEPSDKDVHKEELLAALDDYSLSVNAYLVLLKKDKVSKDELTSAVDELYLNFKFVKEYMNM